MDSAMAVYEQWLKSPVLTPAEHDELEHLSQEEIESRFYAPLSFGTAGLRGTLGMGIHRMNIYVVRQVTQGFASVIQAEGAEACRKGVVICYDCRHFSREFAQAAACVMAGNGIQVRLFDAMRPTPELSFAIRHYGATAGINITASHNPKEYNGYKVYWDDGAQLPPHHADAVAKAIETIDIFSGVTAADFDAAIADGRIQWIGQETDEAFLSHVLAQAIRPEAVQAVAEELSIIYTPFHGTGRILVPEALKRLGIRHLIPVPEQMVPDGDFPTVKSPNPENPEGFYLAVDLAKTHDATLIIGTDPDADRVGVLTRNRSGEFVPITGNQMGVLLLDYMITAKKAQGTLPKNAAALKTIVSTEMARKVADVNGVYMEDTFTGFKFMAEKIKEFQADGSHQVIFSFEESYGYMLGDFVRDKDAVTASMMIAEMAAWYFAQGMTLFDALEALYEKYGYYAERTINLVMPGLDGLEKMAALMAGLRQDSPREIGGHKVSRLIDYVDGRITDFSGGPADQSPLSGSNVLRFFLEDGTQFIVRPSGTEPKIKIYILAQGNSAAACQDKVKACIAYADTLKR